MKRFTETTKWSDPWFRKLAPRLKLLWFYLLDNCDHAGVIDLDWELASFQIGEEVSADDLAAFSGRIEALDGGKFWLLKFIEFQFGNLSETCKAHGPVFKSLENHSLTDRVFKGYPYPLDTHKDKDKDKDKDQDTEKDKDKEPRARAKTDRPTLEQARSVAPMCGVTPDEAETWWNKREATDWMRASGGSATVPVGQNWRADLKQWAEGERQRKADLENRTNGSKSHQSRPSRLPNRNVGTTNDPSEYAGL